MYGDNDPVIAERRKICKSCEHQKMIFNIRTCGICHCMIRAKTALKSQECPIKKWEKVEQSGDIQYQEVLNMATIKHTCENCDNTFAIKYDEEVCESDPIFCPFCAEMLFLDDESKNEDDDL